MGNPEVITYQAMLTANRQSIGLSYDHMLEIYGYTFFSVQKAMAKHA